MRLGGFQRGLAEFGEQKTPNSQLAKVANAALMSGVPAPLFPH